LFGAFFNMRRNAGILKASQAAFETDERRPIAAICTQGVTVQNQKGDRLMKTQVMIASVLVATFAAPFAAQAQGVPGGIAHGIYEGNRRAGPVGAVVGGAVGGVIGGIEGVLGLNTYQASYSEPVTPERPYHPHKHHRKVVPDTSR
jgi:hypothetical protein